MGVRRVVTGHDAGGKAVFASDEEVEPITLDLVPGFEFFRLWGGDEAPTFPDDGSPLPGHAYFPPLGGFRFGLFTVGPESEAIAEDVDIKSALISMETGLPGMAAHIEPGDPGMHTTDTVDFGYVISGEVFLQLDDGAEVHLKAGDTVVQSGTRHRWVNRTDEPCRLVIAVVGAQRS